MLKIVKIKGSYVNGEVCSHCLSEVLIMMLKKCIACGMRCMSICIAVVIFLLSAQSKLPIPETVSFPGLDKFFSLQSFSNIAAIGVNLFNIPMDDMLTLIHAWIAELYELNPDMVWKLPQVAKPHALDDTDDEAIAIVENLMDVRIALYIELVQFLEKESSV